MIFEDENPTKVNYPVGAYAPGHYCSKCISCDKQFMGDKYARQCEPCAINLMSESHERLLVQNRKMESFLEEIKPRFTSELMKPEFDKIEKLLEK